LLDEHHKLDDIHSIRDKRFNDARDALQQWLTQAAFAPEWLRNATAKLAHWRSIRRLLTLIDQWRTQRFPGDESVLETLLAWAERENHLRPWEVHGKDQIIGRRRELYRRFAARIAAKYGTIFVENFDLRQVARKPTAEKGTRGSTPPDWQRTVAAVSTLRSILHSAARRAGAAWASVPAVYSTMECHNCGSVEHFDAAAYITHACKKCGTVWDQDVNAAQIILERGLKVRPLPGEAMHPQTP
jgi:transposase